MKNYFGDGIYVEVDKYGNVELTTNNGFEDTNRIVFDEGTIEQLIPFVHNLMKTDN